MRHAAEVNKSGLEELPRSYRIGLRLRALGADDELIADCLGVDPDSIVTLLEIGARKLEHIEQALESKDHVSGAISPRDAGTGNDHVLRRIFRSS
jgi:hypothetical protein